MGTAVSAYCGPIAVEAENDPDCLILHGNWSECLPLIPIIRWTFIPDNEA